MADSQDESPLEIGDEVDSYNGQRLANGVVVRLDPVLGALVEWDDGHRRTWEKVRLW